MNKENETHAYKENETHAYTEENLEDDFDNMESQLNALLADLQSNLSTNDQHQQQQQQIKTSTTTTTSSKSSYAPNNNSDDTEAYSRITKQNIYQNVQNDVPVPVHHSGTPQNLQNGSQKKSREHSTSHSHHPNSPSNSQNMYRTETREEIRTETHSSGPDPPPGGASSNRSTTNNLSELDSLLKDLNTTKTTSMRKTETSDVNGARPSVDSLINELNSVTHTTETSQDSSSSRYKYGPCYNSGPKHPAPPPSASNATKELDDLMDSLSDFKINPPTVVNTQYAKPKKRSPSPNQLDSMLGSLTVHMTEQGVTTTQKGSCCACDKPIVGQVITALGKTWHPEHFTCEHCQQELGTKNFFERDGKPYCEPDYHNLFSPKCAYCSGPILDKCVTALDKTWHPEHFFCAHCGNTFGDEGFHEKNGKAYCKEDYFNMFAPKCGGCNNPIMENYISALNGQWHPECFVCRDCHMPFNGGSFFDHEGLPYCETHYHAKRGSLCAGCNKPIMGRCITAMFRKYHPEHFVCAFCLQQLNKGTFKEQNDKPYCHTCFDKLYG